MIIKAEPGDTIGIVGGGQLGRMLAMAAASLGLDVRIFDPDPDAPATRVAHESLAASYQDEAALATFAKGLKIATCEFESVPASALDYLVSAGVELRPGIEAWRIASDRVEEKRFFDRVGIPVAPWYPVEDTESAVLAYEEIGGPAILKTRREGYDGKGQIRVESPAAAAEAVTALAGAGAVLECVINFEAEFSMVGIGGIDGSLAAYDLCRNHHENGILLGTEVPARLPVATAKRAHECLRLLQKDLGYVGVVAIEFFQLSDGQVLANEFAPRVHNSGHWTMDACSPGQFEAHIRAVAGWPVPPPVRHADAEMINLIGDDQKSWASWQARPACHVHLYGKREIRPGRKMGHVTRLFTTTDQT